MPNLNPAKFSAGFRKKTENLKKTSGSKILKNRDDERLDHTQKNCLCATSSFSGTHSFHNFPLPSPIFRNAKEKNLHKICANLCPSKHVQKQTKEYVARSPSFSATVSKALLQSGLLSRTFSLPQDLDPLINVAELMVPVKTFEIPSLQKTESQKNVREITSDLREITTELRCGKALRF